MAVGCRRGAVAGVLAVAARSHVAASRVDEARTCAGMVQHPGHPGPDFFYPGNSVQFRDVDFRPRPDEASFRSQGRDLSRAQRAASAAADGEAVLARSAAILDPLSLLATGLPYALTGAAAGSIEKRG